MTVSTAPPRVAVIGMGGFARDHHRALQQLESTGECRVVGACDPQLERFGPEQEAFTARGVPVFSDYQAMLHALAGRLDVCSVPTPVPLHAAMHRACVEGGLACYLEKPPTLYHAELGEMLGVEAGAEARGRATQVGFNFIAETSRQALKSRIVSGEFGRVRRVGFVGITPRKTTYFTRSPWAGRLLLHDGRPVLDSCIGNAMAHYLHNLFFWCGQNELFSWDEAAWAEAELYRAHAIQSFDTCFVRAQTRSGVDLHVAATHAAGPGTAREREWIECDRARITYVTFDTWRIEPAAESDSGSGVVPETGPADPRDLLVENFRAYFAYLRGAADRPLTRLVDARPFVHGYNLLLLAAGHISTVADEHVSRHPDANDKNGGEYVAINGVVEACDTFAATGRFPSEQGVPWSRPGGARVTLADLPDLLARIQQMSREYEAEK